MAITALTAEQRAALFASGALEVQQPNGVTYYANGTAYQDTVGPRVNTTTPGDQTSPLIAPTGDGGRLIIWGSNTGTGWETVMRRFDVAGQPVTGETRVNTTTSGNQSPFALLSLGDGGHMVIWTDDSPGSTVSYVGQRLDASGNKVGGEVPLGSSDYNFTVDFAALTGGGFVRVEAHQGANNPLADLYAHFYDASGAPVGGEVQLTPNGTNLGYVPAITFDVDSRPGGGFVTTYFAPNAGTEVVQAYDAAGVAVGQPLVISNGNSPVRYTELTGGRFLVSWGAGDWHGQIYDAAGSAVGGLLQLSGSSLGAREVTALTDGGFELTWVFSGNGGGAIGGVRFDAAGVQVSDVETLVARGSTPFAMALPNCGFTLAYDDPTSPISVDDVYFRTYTKLDYRVLTSAVDTVVGTGADTLVVGKASDIGGGDSLSGGGGNDTLELTQSGVVDLSVLAAFSGFETLLGASGNDTFVLSAANLAGLTAIDGRGGSNHLQLTGPGPFDLSHIALTGIDVVGTAGADMILLGATNDSVNGGAGDDVINGGAGDDVLSGGPGRDVLTGGPGADVFIATGANFNGDTITDFSVGDVLQINVATTGFSFAGSTLTYDGGALTLLNLPVGYHLKMAPTPGGMIFTLEGSLPSNGLSGDFNGDGKDDLLWRSDSGQLTDWLGQANGGFVRNDANALSSVATSWQVIGAGDFNGDGRDDILWRSDTGQMSDWLGQANGGFANNDVNAFVSVPTSWQVAGVGDFNGDGKSDIVWRSDSGQMSDWLGQANGGFAANDANAYGHVSIDWHIIGVGDFNGDGRDDILWRSESGLMSNWLGQANGGFVGNDGNALLNVPANWHVVGVGDFNGDGRDDILWRSDTGQMSDWLARADGGFTNNDTNAFANVPLDWVIAGVGDYNGDGRADIVWRNTITGAVSNWLGQTNGGFVGNDTNAYQLFAASWHIQVSETFAL